MKLIATALLLLVIVIAGCESGGDYNRSTHLWTTDQGTFAKDPVSGSRVSIASAITRSYLGETYYFESEEHAKSFDAHPNRFVYDDNGPERSSYPGPHGVY